MYNKHEVLNAITKAGSGDGSEQPFFVTYLPHRTGTFKINLFDAIQSAEQFTFALQALEAADEENDVEIHLQCVGGSLGATDAFIHAMRKCRGHIHTIATGGCHSAATMILLESDSFELSSGFHSLVHCGSTGNCGNLNEYLAQTEFDKKFIPEIFRRTYEGFLSTEEIDALLKGQDMWLDGDQWVERFNSRNAYITAKRDALLSKAPELTAEQVIGIMKIVGDPAAPTIKKATKKKPVVKLPKVKAVPPKRKPKVVS